jgi:hypothetical protein
LSQFKGGQIACANPNPEDIACCLACLLQQCAFTLHFLQLPSWKLETTFGGNVKIMLSAWLVTGLLISSHKVVNVIFFSFVPLL